MTALIYHQPTHQNLQWFRNGISLFAHRLILLSQTITWSHHILKHKSSYSEKKMSRKDNSYIYNMIIIQTSVKQQSEEKRLIRCAWRPDCSTVWTNIKSPHSVICTHTHTQRTPLNLQCGWSRLHWLTRWQLPNAGDVCICVCVRLPQDLLYDARRGLDSVNVIQPLPRFQIEKPKCKESLSTAFKSWMIKPQRLRYRMYTVYGI